MKPETGSQVIEHAAACRGKAVYLTWTAAERKARRMRHRTRERLEPYRCRFCGRWHVGHKGLGE